MNLKKNDLLKSIAKKLKTARERKDISVYQLSKMSGISETHIRDLERGDRNPSFSTLDRLTKPLGISLSEFFNANGDVTHKNDASAVRTKLGLDSNGPNLRDYVASLLQNEK